MRENVGWRYMCTVHKKNIHLAKTEVEKDKRRGNPFKEPRWSSRGDSTPDDTRTQTQHERTNKPRQPQKPLNPFRVVLTP